MTKEQQVALQEAGAEIALGWIESGADPSPGYEFVADGDNRLVVETCSRIGLDPDDPDVWEEVAIGYRAALRAIEY